MTINKNMNQLFGLQHRGDSPDSLLRGFYNLSGIVLLKTLKDYTRFDILFKNIIYLCTR